MYSSNFSLLCLHLPDPPEWQSGATAESRPLSPVRRSSSPILFGQCLSFHVYIGLHVDLLHRAIDPSSVQQHYLLEVTRSHAPRHSLSVDAQPTPRRWLQLSIDLETIWKLRPRSAATGHPRASQSQPHCFGETFKKYRSAELLGSLRMI